MSNNAANNSEPIRAKAFAARDALLTALADPEGTQNSLLAHILRRNSGTQFGIYHDFADLRGADDFRSGIPIRMHEDFEPWLDRAIAGEANVLADEEAMAYFSSSGTTGREKQIPVTLSYLTESFIPFYFTGLANLLDRHPDVLADDNAVLNLWQDPDAPIDRTAGGQPHLGASQLDYERFGRESAVGLGNHAVWSRLPAELHDADPLTRTYAKVRIAAEYDVRCVFAVNPAIAHALPTQLRMWWPRIAEEIRRGTVADAPFSVGDPARATQIETTAARTGTVRPKDLWPNLTGVVTWTAYTAGLYLPKLMQDYGPNVEIVAAPIGSSEGPLAAPIDRHPTGAPLAITSSFLEFVPVEDEIRPTSSTLLAHQLELGRHYHVVMTRLGGIYRCATRDIVRVVGFVGRTPRIAYRGRQGDLIAGSARLREDQIIQAVRDAVSESGLAVENLAARVSPSAVSRYEIAVEFDRNEPPTETQRFAALLDTHLARESASYADARERGSIDAVRVLHVPPSTFMREWLERVASGQRPTRIKDRVFAPTAAAWSTASPAEL
ncbi:GH3 family domain-containing protein [Nocardia asteroides]|uniref:GH3 family domain-containing protein n=1 Tax=Nocardia asteroides TaxID=1824 RepID=UPI003401ED99